MNQALLLFANIAAATASTDNSFGGLFVDEETGDFHLRYLESCAIARCLRTKYCTMVIIGPFAENFLSETCICSIRVWCTPPCHDTDVSPSNMIAPLTRSIPLSPSPSTFQAHPSVALERF